MIRHIPHASTYIPKEYSDFKGEYIDLSDKNVLDIFANGKCLIFPIDRNICDVERFIDNEPMESKGMGVCYTNNANMQEFREVSEELRLEIIDKYYVPHHKLLKQMVKEELFEYGKSLIIDCHTYRKEPWAYEDATKVRPEICIGTNKDTESSELIKGYLEKYFDVGYNTPFAGALAPVEYMNNNSVESIMLEVRQDVSIEKARYYINSVLEMISNSYYNIPLEGLHYEQ